MNVYFFHDCTATSVVNIVVVVAVNNGVVVLLPLLSLHVVPLPNIPRLVLTATAFLNVLLSEWRSTTNKQQNIAG